MIIGVDVGGTFTDFVAVSGGRILTHKVLSTPDDPSRAFLVGLAEVEGDEQADEIVHGSTVATNAILERKGAVTALITTKGFKDILEIGRQTRPKIYDLYVRKPSPLVPERLRVEVDERVDYTGAILEDLQTGEVEAVLRRLQGESVESVAVCLLFSFVNPHHESLITSMARELGFFVSASHNILPEYREYERTSTVVLNAYVSPLMHRYISRLEGELFRKRRSSFRIMQSNGGTISALTAKDLAIRTALSGPAAGVTGASYVAELAGYDNIITFDMGGTSTDVSLCPGRVQYTTEAQIGGFPVRLPTMDIHTVGAGGGSIARIDEAGALMVGPQSAGSDPGPVCYGKGEDITVTDANLCLGRLQPDFFLGGRMPLDRSKAERRMEELASRLGKSPTEAALGVVEVANSNMENAIRVISVERGFDPRLFTLVAFGGAGPLHACDLADNLGAPRVFISLHPGVLSALGMLAADLVKDYSRTIMMPASEVDKQTLASFFSELERRGFEEMKEEGVDPAVINANRYLDMRYLGQSFELVVPADTLNPSDFLPAFHVAHKARFGYSSSKEPVEVVNIRLRLTSRVQKPQFSRFPEAGTDAAEGAIDIRPVCFPARRDGPGGRSARADHCWLQTTVYERSRLHSGNSMAGPAVIVQMDTTTVVPPEWSAKVDPLGNIIVERR